VVPKKRQKRAAHQKKLPKGTRLCQEKKTKVLKKAHRLFLYTETSRHIDEIYLEAEGVFSWEEGGWRHGQYVSRNSSYSAFNEGNAARRKKNALNNKKRKDKI